MADKDTGRAILLLYWLICLNPCGAEIESPPELFFLRGFGLMGAGPARVAGGTCCGVMGVKEQARWEYKGKKTEVG